ncbi:S-methyl-5-thioribose-1-phosphate isomerase [Desulfobacterota bacterium AH_259_B03_O07]|nr:S-methyl-5-thioribose-1-phosphate isomerase [Desulfobacterota bacterium AH_259_B03_O07]
MSSFKTIEWKNDRVVMIDQRKLPSEEVYIECLTYKEVAKAIKEMVIRGAPAIGIAAAMGIALGALKSSKSDKSEFLSELDEISLLISTTRPTAVNLFWAINRMKELVDRNKGEDIDFIKNSLVEEAKRIYEEDVETCRRIGSIGAKLIEDGSVVLTHCNAGSLATADYGTALGIVRNAFESGKKIKVIATETRPYLQGARLTAWELNKDGLPVSLITDSTAGYVMSRGMVDTVIVGADRIASNGDVANKIGTYVLSVLAKSHDIPFYVAAPVSTIDYDCSVGEMIPIEERNIKEVTHIMGNKIAPDVNVLNPAFDITPNENVSSIITEKGIASAPYLGSLKELLD